MGKFGTRAMKACFNRWKKSVDLQNLQGSKGWQVFEKTCKRLLKQSFGKYKVFYLKAI